MYRSPDVLRDLTVTETVSIRQAIEAMDEHHLGVVLVVNDSGVLTGILTDGDLRRAILSNTRLDGAVSSVMMREPTALSENEATENTVLALLEDRGLRHLPIVDNEGKPTDLIAWNDLESAKLRETVATYRNLDCDVVIMAGGKGSRLDPFTRILPKPLVPIGDKPVLEVIMDDFRPYGVDHFYVSVNHMRKMIRVYLESVDLDSQVELVEEDKPLGTAGALQFIKGRVTKPFFVVNCDVLIRADYADIYDHHVSNGHKLTVVGSLKNHTVPYGVCEMNADGSLAKISEKPRYDFIVNTGMYVLSPEVLELIPPDREFHMTHLIEAVLEQGGSVGVFPIGEKAWLDTGQWEEYRRALKLLGKV
ncbi:D-glycero-alpha-D-manno-heptose 1-phosphate guanylyltransferase [bacterium BMS3Bbin04]|nr:D-glycero-alpha-D-manno-heptose 1-phosphate guanylyltransferase [bacterium BMS3Bbin04]